MSKIDPNDLFSLRFQMNRADLAARHALRREITGWRLWALFAPAFLVGAGYAVVEDEIVEFAPWFRNHETIAALLCLVVVYGILTLGMTLARKRFVDSLPVPTSETLIEADKQHLSITENGLQRSYRWDDFQWPILTDDHVFLQATVNDIITIPLHAFDDQADKTAFTAAINDWMKGDTNDDEGSYVS
jgi:hypothetical protein